MGDGHIMDFLKNHKPTDTKRLALILDVALGLQYLHEKKVVHGDLKGLNILVTPSHRACIADFGVSSIADSITVRFTHSTVTARAGTARYQAPELFDMENPVKIHYGSDIYAFACVCYEILTGQVPFRELQNDMAVMMKVAGGYRPPRPTSSPCTVMLDNLWELMKMCWEGQSIKRPTAYEVARRLEGPSIRAKPTPFTADWDEKFTSKFRRSVQGDPLLPSVTQIECMLFGEEIAQGLDFYTRENVCLASIQLAESVTQTKKLPTVTTDQLCRNGNPGAGTRSQRSQIPKTQYGSNLTPGTQSGGDWQLGKRRTWILTSIRNTDLALYLHNWNRSLKRRITSADEACPCRIVPTRHSARQQLCLGGNRHASMCNTSESQP
ncbi:Protein kinase domain-containing protein [Mycena sanguinolenta]|uniref:Protein kinase domain-containing protein n=1 Tax=Mycena sanguinolenta TaxID=230812 RepID=A0A8H6ZHC8_9AGAR|nr:Protein kinase domain-containing protein [Mycena sanguinolenta]